MGRSPKSTTRRHSSSNRREKRHRRDDSSSSSGSDHDRHRDQRRKGQHNDTRTSASSSQVKQEPKDDRPKRRQTQDPSYQWGKPAEKEKEKEIPVEKDKPNFALSGALLKDTNTYKGVVIKYCEPLEARKPKRRWRLYVFKGDQVSLDRRFCASSFFLYSFRNCRCIKFIVNQHF